MKTAFSTRTAFVSAVVVLGFTGFARAGDVVGSGHVSSETRQVGGFHGVNLRGSGEVIVTQGETEGLVIDAEDNILPLIESTVGRDGVLQLGFKPHSGNIQTHKEVIYKLAVKTLDALAVAGSGSIRAATLAAGHARLSVPGSGAITVDQLRADAADISIDGSGTVMLNGEAHRETVSVNGSGNCKARDFRTGDATVVVNGSGEAEVQASGTLAAEINGSGGVGYAGGATVTKTVHGSGRVRPLSAKNDD